MIGEPQPREWSHERSFPTGTQHAFDTLVVADLTRLFDRWWGPLPPVTEVRDQEGRWGYPGQTRTVVTGDRGRLREQLLEVDPPRLFRYRLDVLGGPMRPVMTSVEGSWQLRPAGTGVRVRWTWRVHPSGRGGALALPGVGRLWQGYARRAFERVEGLLVP